MTVIRAKNSLHRRVLDTSKFWWVADAWDQRTLEWFATERDGSSRISHLLHALDDRRLSTVPNFQPTAEWIVQLLAEAPSMKLTEGNVTPREWLEKASARDRSSSQGWGSSTIRYSKYQKAMEVVIRSIRLSHEDLEQQYKTEFPAAVFGNPTLPSLTAAEGSSSTPYQIMLRENLDAWKNPNDTGRRYDTSKFVNILLTNPGASNDDLLRAWVALQETTNPEDVPWGVRQQYESFVSTLLSHPNWDRESPAVPNTSELQRLAGNVEWPTAMKIHPGGRQGPTQQLIGVTPVLDGTYDNAAQEFIFRRSRSSALEIVRESLKAWESDAPEAKASRARIAVGYFAPVLGAYFSDLAAKYGTDDIPLDWLIELS